METKNILKNRNFSHGRMRQTSWQQVKQGKLYSDIHTTGLIWITFGGSGFSSTEDLNFCVRGTPAEKTDR